MNKKKLLEMLNRINEQKKKVKDLVDAGKLEEAKAEKEELVKMQETFDILKCNAGTGRKYAGKRPCEGLCGRRAPRIPQLQ